MDILEQLVIHMCGKALITLDEHFGWSGAVRTVACDIVAGSRRPLHIFRNKDDEPSNEPAAAQAVVQFLNQSIVEVYPKEDDFQFLKNLSNGAFGSVALVRKNDNKKLLAIKIIDKQKLKDPFQIEQVFNERNILHRVSGNPAIVDFFGSYTTAHHLCIIFDFIQAGDFETILNLFGALNVEMARFFTAELILGIEWIHSKGIIHGDLKPANLLLTAQGHLKITDFGVSCVADSEGKFPNNRIFGTPSHMAPEVVMAILFPEQFDPIYGPPVDWYAVGVILYRFLTGSSPFVGETQEQLYISIVFGKIEWSEFPFPAEIQDLLDSLLQRDPQRRLATIGGAEEVKTHPFFTSIIWALLFHLKPAFTPILENPMDTAFFDHRLDQYNHLMNPEERDPILDHNPMFNHFPSICLNHSGQVDAVSRSPELIVKSKGVRVKMAKAQKVNHQFHRCLDRNRITFDRRKQVCIYRRIRAIDMDYPFSHCGALLVYCSRRRWIG